MIGIGSIVIYDEEEYIVFWIYDNDYCEIQKNTTSVRKVELVRLDELMLKNK